MKKNVIALAVAAAVAAPMAQAEVSVSGSLQAELQSVSADRAVQSAKATYTITADSTTVNINSNLSVKNADGMQLDDGGRGKIEIKASEDLGNGMKALAKYAFNATVDGDGITQRDAYIGLTGGFGTVLAGTMSNPYKGSTVSWDPFLETSAQARGNGGMSAEKGFGHSGYTGNALAYANKFGMAKVVLAYVVDETIDDYVTTADQTVSTTGNDAISASVNVPVGPVEIAVAMIDADDLGKSSDPTDASSYMNATKVGVKYTAGAITVAAQMENWETGTKTATVDKVKDTDYMYLNGTYTMGANTFAIAYGTSEEDLAGANNNVDYTYTAIGVTHKFSKTTKVYANWRQTDKDNEAPLTKDGDVTVLALGMRVDF